MQTKCNNNGMMKHIQRFKKVINFSLKNKYILHNPFNGFRILLKEQIVFIYYKDELQDAT